MEHENLLELCYKGGYGGWILAWFMLSPYAVLILGNGVSLLYGSDFAFFATYNFSVSLNLFLAYFLNIGLKDLRPVAAQQCNYLSYGLPDVQYVTAVSMLLILSFVGFFSLTRIRKFGASAFLLLAILYTVSIGYNEFLTTAQLLHTISLTLALSAFWTFFYIHFLLPLDSIAAHSWVMQWLAITDGLLLK